VAEINLNEFNFADEQSEDEFNERTDQGEQGIDLSEFNFRGEAGKAPLGKRKLPFQEQFDKFPIPYQTVGPLWFADKLWQNLDFIPFAKYFREEDREEYYAMSQGDQNKALAMETLGATLWLGGGLIAKGVGKGVKAGYNLTKRGLLGLKQTPKMAPIEDIGRWTSQNYLKVAGKFLTKDIGLKNVEAQAVVGALHGKGTMLKDAVVNAMGKPSQRFLDMIENIPGQPYVQYRLRKDVLRGLADYSPETVRNRHLIKEFGQAVRKQRIFGKGKIDATHVETIYKAEAHRFYGKLGARGKTFATATDKELVNFTDDILKNPIGLKSVVQMTRPVVAHLFRPIRQVFGYGDDLMGTYRFIYKPVKDALGRTNVYTGEKVAELQKMLIERGFMKTTKGGRVVRTKLFTKDVADASAKVMSQVDDWMGQIAKAEDPRQVAILREKIANVFDGVASGVDKTTVGRLVDVTHSHWDKLYAERFVWKLGDVFEKAGLNTVGRGMSEKFMETVSSKIRFAFSSKAGFGSDKKLAEINKVFDEVKGMLTQQKRNPVASWFQDRGEATFRNGRKLKDGKFEQVHWMDDLAKEFKLSDKGQFFQYLENYMPRLGERGARATEEIFGTIGGKLRTFYTRARVAEAGPAKRLEFENLIHSRIRAQAKEMFLHQDLQKVAQFAKGLPQEWKNIVEQWYARILNLPARGDVWAGKMLEHSVGNLQRAFGGTGLWDPFRVMRLSQNINDLTYMGFLGFKPFSAMRNLFQPLLLVPADMGGLKNIQHLAKGYKIGFSEVGRKYLKSIGIITDYAPELRRTPKIFKFGKKIGKVDVPSKEEVRDVSMWLFQNSDRWNRYVTGGAAMSKWESVFAKSGLKNIKPDAFLNPTKRVQRMVDNFMEKVGANGRHPWMKSELESTLKAGRFDDAKATFIRDVVGDTQFLYGGTDAPLVTHIFGAPGRTATIFQSWWMNYGTLMHKWMTQGYADKKLQGVMAWMIPQAIGYTAMRELWGTQTARRSTLLGPFPMGAEGIPWPPMWEPIVKLGLIATEMGGVAVGASEPKDVGRRIKALGWTAVAFAPGGLQLKQFIRGGMKEGGKGVGKAVIRWSPPER